MTKKVFLYDRENNQETLSFPIFRIENFRPICQVSIEAYWWQTKFIENCFLINVDKFMTQWNSSVCNYHNRWVFLVSCDSRLSRLTKHQININYIENHSNERHALIYTQQQQNSIWWRRLVPIKKLWWKEICYAFIAIIQFFCQWMAINHWLTCISFMDL